MPKFTKKACCYGRTDPNYRKASFLKIEIESSKKILPFTHIVASFYSSSKFSLLTNDFIKIFIVINFPSENKRIIKRLRG